MIYIENLNKSYRDEVVLDNYSLEIEKNSLTCILGQSGKGKTTLLRILMGLETADSGSIRGLENSMKSAVFQEDRLCEGLNMYSNILLPHIQKDTNISLDKIKNGISALQLDGNETKLVSELSGGMKRRVAILRALLCPYDVLFLDEPFKGLDGDTKAKTMDYFMSETKGKTVILITHDEYEVQYLKPNKIINL